MKLYHGTSKTNATKILNAGFRRSIESSYTGTGINLTEQMTIAYEYGSYEAKGCVLECEIGSAALIHDIGLTCPSDGYFKNNIGVDAVKSYGGNVWVVWNPNVIVSVRKMTKAECVKLLHGEFKEDGQNMAYNGCVQDHCELFWGGKIVS